jgi:DNA adenine methylase
MTRRAGVSFSSATQAAWQRDDDVRPFLKWAGGKRQLLPAILGKIPAGIRTYFEPFAGGGAVLFALQPPRACINDANAELVNLYRVVQSDPEALIASAKKHRHSETYYYKQRALDRSEGFSTTPAVNRASRILFLNKTCYNGLFRVNRSGQFNAPFGHYKNPCIVDEAVIRAVSRYFNEAQVTITCEDFAEAVVGARKGDFVYLDPPYDPVSDTASFTSYHLNRFGKDEQRRLKALCDDLTRRQCRLLLSNSDTAFIRELYGDKKRYTLTTVAAKRNINSVGSGRGKISELLIENRVD